MKYCTDRQDKVKNITQRMHLKFLITKPTNTQARAHPHTRADYYYYHNHHLRLLYAGYPYTYSRHKPYL